MNITDFRKEIDSKYKNWIFEQCTICLGYGIVGDYGKGDDFYGDIECSSCRGKGHIWISPKGRIADYPGGPFRGQK